MEWVGSGSSWSFGSKAKSLNSQRSFCKRSTWKDGEQNKMKIHLFLLVLVFLVLEFYAEHAVYFLSRGLLR